MKHRTFESVNAARGLDRRQLLAILAATALAGCATLPASLGTPQILADIVRLNTAARGGAAALDKVHSLAIDAEIVEGGQTLNGRYAADTSGNVRIDIYADGKNVYSEGVDDAGVWRWTGGPGPAEPSKADGAANALTNGAEQHLFGWHRFASRGHAMALKPAEMLDGVRHPVVEVKFSTGQTSYFYVDPSSWQVVRRRDVRAYHPDNDLTKQRIESRFFDFVSVGGVVASHRSQDIDLATGKTLATSRVLKRVVNPVLPAGYFDRDRRAPASL